MCSQLYLLKEKIEKVIAEKNLDPFKTTGMISLKCGFAIGLLSPNTTDDPMKEAKLRSAINEILKINL